MKAVLVSFMYRCGGNYKTTFDKLYINGESNHFDEVCKLKVGTEITMGDFDTLKQSEFFSSEIHPYHYDDTLDHNLLSIEKVEEVEDLFAHYSDLPDVVKEIFDSYDVDYFSSALFDKIRAELNLIGYEVELGMDRELYDLRCTKGELFPRKCDCCNKGMNEGYCINGGEKYFCSTSCLDKSISEEEKDVLCIGAVDSDSYYSSWEELDESVNYTFNGTVVYGEDFNQEERKSEFEEYIMLHNFMYTEPLKGWINEATFTNLWNGDDWNTLMELVTKIKMCYAGVENACDKIDEALMQCEIEGVYKEALALVKELNVESEIF